MIDTYPPPSPTAGYQEGQFCYYTSANHNTHQVRGQGTAG